MPNKQHIIIYSHGFGVRKDDHGLFTDIVAALPQVDSVLFDYFAVDENEKKIFIVTLSSQVDKLNQIIRDIRTNNPTAVIDLVCHSQGTIVAAMARPDGVRKAILLAPVFDMSLERTLARYQAKSGALINLDGISSIPSSDGLTRIIPKEYWQERLAVKPFTEYNAFAKKIEIIAIEANQDELLPRVDLEELNSQIKLISIDGNHGFNNAARPVLIELIKSLLL
jgi:pimeloyl-ACP methyl ester carboxylesterase